LANAAAAQAKPDFALVESEARAGDIVHFAITGARSPVKYELEIGDDDVLEDAVGSGSVIAGEFRLPDFGHSNRTVTVKAEIRESGDKTKANGKLRYLGRALPAPRLPDSVPATALAADPPAAAAPAAAPPALAPPAAPPPGPAATTKPQPTTPVSGASKARRRSGGHRRPRERAAARGRTRAGKPHQGRDTPRRKRRATGPGPRTAPLFDGVPEAGYDGRSDRRKRGHSSITSLLPTEAGPAADTAAEDAQALTALLVPGLAAVAAITLAGAALHRRRRLRSAR
jgi:hypothetical protein